MSCVHSVLFVFFWWRDSHAETCCQVHINFLFHANKSTKVMTMWGWLYVIINTATCIIFSFSHYIIINLTRWTFKAQEMSVTGPHSFFFSTYTLNKKGLPGACSVHLVGLAEKWDKNKRRSRWIRVWQAGVLFVIWSEFGQRPSKLSCEICFSFEIRPYTSAGWRQTYLLGGEGWWGGRGAVQCLETHTCTRFHTDPAQHIQISLFTSWLNWTRTSCCWWRDNRFPQSPPPLLFFLPGISSGR